jgi:hypothetical protein
MAGQPIKISTRLVESDWDPTYGGWRCDALRIPGANVISVYYDGRQAGKKEFTQEDAFILWADDKNRPREIGVTIEFTIDLSKLEEDKFNLEREKFKLEQEKQLLEKKKYTWQKISILGTIMGIILSSFVTFVISTRRNSIANPGDPLLLSISSVLGDCGNVSINASSSTVSGTSENLILSWDWGDGTVNQGSFPASHQYSKNGTYSVKLRAQNDRNQSVEKAITVNVTTVDKPDCK